MIDMIFQHVHRKVLFYGFSLSLSVTSFMDLLTELKQNLIPVVEDRKTEHLRSEAFHP